MIALVLAVLLILAGGVLFVCTMATLHWDFTKLSTIKYETNTYEISEAFHTITMNTDTADIIFVPSDDEKCRVVCYEETNANHAVAVKDGALTIELVEDKTVSDYIRNIGINFESAQITVYLPQAEYKALVIREDTGDVQLPKEIQFESVDISVSTGDITCFASVSGQLKIKTSAGDIRVEDVTADDLDLAVSTGDVQLENIRCNALLASGNTGDISLKNVIATETISIIRTTGDVRFYGADAATIFVETDTGDVTGTLMSAKQFLPQSDTGDIEVPQTSSGGKCEIITSTGDIKLMIQ
jgi:DUF4097 and DUF4098 domain-containing protein YvlB